MLNMLETKLFKSVLPFCKFCVALLVPSIVLTSFIGLGFCSILFTITILVSSTIFLVTLTNKKRSVVVLEENPVSKDLSEGEAEEKVLQPVIESVPPESNAAAQEAGIGIVHDDFQVKSLGSTSDSESSDDSGSSSNLDLNWMIPGNNAEQNPEISDDSVSADEEEEEGLIEIAIPGNAESEPKVVPPPNLQSNLPPFLPESIFKQQQDLVDFSAEINEVNEEENLIEIDISIGSIKCPRFEIEA
ncbi:uncharacterized protein LOC110419533 [Herrania umbratica]|uniref:Uncharacterized protein LOC110419533 n=1 Tax=Herrania umbratica TaxID=108875 RepID=A0A6J1AMW8_9ROSI|nr:uncharacterized protein LOC110419533 [Herrania umbratica]